MIDGRRLMMRGVSGSGAKVESGQFTVSTKTRTYDIPHNLGEVPNFVFIYPIDVHDETSTYLIMSQIIVDDCGQEDWRAGTDTSAKMSMHGMWRGVGYATSVHGSNPMDNLPSIGAGNITYAGLFTNSFVRVGAANQTNSGGSLLGTYGYVVGVMPLITANE